MHYFSKMNKESEMLYGEILRNESYFLLGSSGSEELFYIEKAATNNFFIVKIPFRKLTADGKYFLTRILLTSPELTENIYVGIKPFLFEGEPNENVAERFFLEIPSKKYRFVDMPFGAYIRPNYQSEDLNEVAEFNYERGKEYWIHLEQRETSNWALLITVTVLFITLSSASYQYLQTKEEYRKILDLIETMKNSSTTRIEIDSHVIIECGRSLPSKTGDFLTIPQEL